MTQYPQLTDNALKVLRARYLIKDAKGRVTESPDEMFRRVARAVASAEDLHGDSPAKWEETFFDLMRSLRFLPNSPALMNAGRSLGQLAACFVLPVEDSMQSIFDTLRNAALILKSGGGTGFSFSRLRPSEDMVKSTGGIASGPVSFMRIYNTATEVIKQGGARRGANMGILRVDHPDILEFIGLKRNPSELENFNTSVAITDTFMRALKTNGNYALKSPKNGTEKTHKTISARMVFDEIVKSAWETGDPGVIFIDRINRANPTPHLGSFESTNPCGEQPLLPYEACVLGSMNLSAYVHSGKIDYKSLGDDVRIAVRFLDNTIDVNHYPLAEIERMHKGNRKIGLGVMGLADMLILSGIPYDSPQALRLSAKVMRFIQKTSQEASAMLALERGAFPNLRGSVFDSPGKPSQRNATVTTVAPTGTISIIADCSSGIEPFFALANRRMALEGEMLETNKHFFAMANDQGVLTKTLQKEVLSKGSLKGLIGIPSEFRRLFKTAHEIPAEQHIRMQAAFQRYTDNAVSKTINLPCKASKKDVGRAFMLAYQSGCKGVTIFRYGASKTGPLLINSQKNKKPRRKHS